MNRRGFLKAILAAGVAPYVVTTAGVLMPVEKIVTVVVITLEKVRRAAEILRAQNVPDLERFWLEACERAVNPPIVMDAEGRFAQILIASQPPDRKWFGLQPIGAVNA